MLPCYHPSFFEQVGILLPIFGTQSFSISPSTCGPLGGHWTKGIFGVEHPTGSNPTLAAETRVTGTSFLQAHIYMRPAYIHNRIHIHMHMYVCMCM